ncbi:sigma-70 family RNA polymerase sigma factor [Sphingomonas sp.]|jgi:RNA polymerase sigma-32 factor|uniref:sigma-70 family RNA polymerase sigma factor n=1 Tax=Sphingomonas sp. TaxID=28214 RepID=UPI002ED8CA7D
MSKTTAALEAAVAIVIANAPQGDERQSNRQRVHSDRAFASILKLIAPRIRHFIRQYGLIAHWDDAEQCCAIGVHRAIEAYDPAKAQFTTFVNWQIRGELQALRFRLMADQRPSAKKVAAVTVSLHAVSGSEDGETSLESMIVDEDALERTEAAASAYMADATRTKLIDEYVDHLRTVGLEQINRRARTKPVPALRTDPAAPRLRTVDAAELAALEDKIALHREAIERRLSSDVETEETIADEAARERTRQVARRATAAMADLADRAPRFATALRAPAEPRWRRPAKPELQAAHD